MLTRIAVGTDGSDSASRAVAHAARLADATGAELVVVHAFGGVDRPDSPVGTRDIGTSLLRDVTGRHVVGGGVRGVLREGDAAEVLLAAARDDDADLIVVGNRGMGRRGPRIGNVPNRVAHRSPCSVLVAETTRTPREGTYDRVLLATDGSSTAARAVAFGASLAAHVGAEAILLHVGEDEGLAVRAARDLPCDARPLTARGDAASRIREVAEAEDVDLIVIGNRGMTGLRRFVASVPSRVAHEAPCHVLLVKTT